MPPVLSSRPPHLPAEVSQPRSFLQSYKLAISETNLAGVESSSTLMTCIWWPLSPPWEFRYLAMAL